MGTRALSEDTSSFAHYLWACMGTRHGWHCSQAPIPLHQLHWYSIVGGICLRSLLWRQSRHSHWLGNCWQWLWHCMDWGCHLWWYSWLMWWNSYLLGHCSHRWHGQASMRIVAWQWAMLHWNIAPLYAPADPGSRIPTGLKKLLGGSTAGSATITFTLLGDIVCMGVEGGCIYWDSMPRVKGGGWCT